MIEQPLLIPHEQLTQDTLLAVIEEFVTREGTDYGQEEFSLPQKVQQVLQGIKTGQYLLIFDQGAESLHILTKEQWQLTQSTHQEAPS